MLEKHAIFPFFLYKLQVFCELHLFADYYIRFCKNYMFGVSSEVHLLDLDSDCNRDCDPDHDSDHLAPCEWGKADNPIIQ